ncbi:MAG: CHASE domain-containing protein [Polyangiales bacterium]
MLAPFSRKLVGPEVKSLTRFADTWTRLRPLEGQRRAIAAFVVGLALTAIAFYTVRHEERLTRRDQFERRASELTSSLRTQLELPLETVRLMPALFDTPSPVTREDFLHLVGPSLARHPVIAHLEWAPEVLDKERPEFERRLHELGMPNFFIGDPGADGKLRPAPKRPRYLPLLYIVPASDSVFGLDIAWEPARRELALRALSEDMLTVSPQFRMVEDPPEVRAVAVYAPLIKPRHPSDDPRGPRRGLAILIVRLAPMVRTVLGDKLDKLDVVLVDESAPEASEVLFESRPGLSKRKDAEFEDAFSQSFEFHSRHWLVRFMAKPGTASAQLLSPVIASFGALLSLATMLILGTLDFAKRLRQEVQTAQQIGQYRLYRKLGEGGMGVVYEAEHALLRRPTAVKVISPKAVGHEALERFEREVKATSQLTHPNTIAVYDYGRAPHGGFYYAMEYLPGANTEQIVRVTGPMPESRVVHLLRQICGSLSEAHAAGLVHRDIKPPNLMCCLRGGIHDFVKVLDFGLVKNTRAGEPVASVAGAIVGTPHYMAPEIVLNKGASPSTDLYALGAVGYFLLTGSEVFRSDTLLGVIAHHVSDKPQRPSERLGAPLHPGLEALILRCLAKTAVERPASARELDALLGALDIAPWTQAQATAFWTREREHIQDAVAAEQGTGATPLGDTLVVDLQDRSAFTSSTDLGESNLSVPVEPAS